MGRLRELLEAKAAVFRDERATAESRVNEWNAAVDRLLEKLTGWLDEADPDRVLSKVIGSIRLNERGLGAYDPPALTIDVGTRSVRIEPVARYTRGPRTTDDPIGTSKAYGRVDLTNDLARFRLYRVRRDPADSWVLAGHDGRLLRDLDRDAFEAAIASLLE